MRYIVSYDVSSDYDKYRTKIAQILIDYGLERIQYSVFIGSLTKTIAREIISKINAVIKEECPIDIRFFRYCAGCLEDSFIITKDIKMPGFVLTKMEDALNVHVSYLTGKKFGIDIDQNGWLEVYPREPVECSENKKNKKENQKKTRKNQKTTKNITKEIKSDDSNDKNPNNIDRDDKDNNKSIREDWIKTEKESFEYLKGLDQEELNDFMGLSSLEDLQEFTEYVLKAEKIEKSSENDSNLLEKMEIDNVEKRFNLRNKNESEEGHDDKQINNELDNAILSDNDSDNDPIYTMSKHVMFF